jgi:hypothetical protein
MFTSAAAKLAVQLLLANLPQIIASGPEVFAFVKAGIAHLEAIFSKSAKPATEADVVAALTKEALQAIEIAAIK